MPPNVTRARQLRRAMTPPEARLWTLLRTRPGAFKFRRQHPLGRYVLDFFCSEAGLAIEIDGIAHDMGTNPGRDARRDAWFAENHIKTLRFAAIEMRDNPEAVVTAIVAECQARAPFPRNRGEDI